jgi:hypothetical protein
MQQALVAAILRKLHPSSRTQTLFAGGVPAARKAVATAYHEEGMRYGVEVDFVDFYGSIAPDGLAELLRPLPATVVEHVIWDVAMRDDPSLSVVVGNTAHPTLSAPSGLSLGASTSPVVGERVIARLLAVAQLPETITYADNLFVMARTEAEVRERIHRLGGSIAAASFGALRLREGFTYGYDLSRPFEFMKQEGRVRDRSLMIDAGIDWSPSEAKQDQYRISAVERRLTLAEIAAAERRVGQWRRSYPTWPDGDEREAEYLAGLAARRYYVESSPANLSSAIHAVVVAFHAAGGMSSYAELVPTEGDPSGERRQELLTELARWLDNAARRARPLALR